MYLCRLTYRNLTKTRYFSYGKAACSRAGDPRRSNEQYGSTPSGNLAKHYAGICYLKTGDLENAAKYLAKYSPVKGIPGALINAQNLGLQGDIAVEQQNYAKAVKFYEQAVKAADNNLTAPMYLRKAGLAEQAQGNNEKAAAFYEQILTSYPASTDAREAEKLLGSVK